MRRLGDLLEPYKGYYSFPFSGEPYEGEIINLNEEECRIFFHIEGSGDEYKFREKLHRMDEWFYDKPYNVQVNWKKHVAKWLAPRKQDND